MIKAGSFTPSGTGDITVNNLTFMPTRIFVRIGPQTNSVDATKTARCDGWATVSNQSYDAWYIDATQRRQKAGTDKILTNFDKVGSNIVETINASFVDFHENTPTNFGFTLNYSLNDVVRQVRYMCDDA